MTGWTCINGHVWDDHSPYGHGRCPMCGDVRAQRNMTSPYDTLGRDFEERVLDGGRVPLSQPKTTLADRLMNYAFHVQENAKTTGDAILVSDLLDAARALSAPTDAEERGRLKGLEEAAKVAEQYGCGRPGCTDCYAGAAAVAVRALAGKTEEKVG